MMDIKVKSKDAKFSIPVPYSVLSVLVSVLSSNLINRLVDRWTKKYSTDKNTAITIPTLDKKLLKQIIRELKQHKGTELVYVKAKDGSEVKIKL
jgi:hypothetical protein